MHYQNQMTATVGLIAAILLGYIALWVSLAAFIGSLFIPLYLEWYVYLTFFFLILMAVERGNKEMAIQDARFRTDKTALMT